MDIQVLSHRRRNLYHSVQTPGYTCWTGLWQASDASLGLSFTEARGPLSGWRPRSLPAVLRRMPKANQEIPGYDMVGVAMENVYLRSADRGKTWRKTHTEPFASCLNGFCNGFIALADGGLLRSIWGQSLTTWDLPATGMLQRSADGGKTWDAPKRLDESLQTWPKRLRRLRDGRIFLTGAACTYDPETWTWEAQSSRIRPCFWVSRDPGGAAWDGPVYLYPDTPADVGEEWDIAELDSGDLLAVLRTARYDRAGKYQSQQRRQCLLRKRGATWEPGPLTDPPFTHAGHPELLRLKGSGAVLHIAANGLWWTGRGDTWTKLDVPPTAYYPTAWEVGDGHLVIVSHVGSDDAYGKVDQAIVMDTLRLKVT